MNKLNKISSIFTKEQNMERRVSKGVVSEGGKRMPKNIYEDPNLRTVGVTFSPAPRKEKVPCCKSLWFVVVTAVIIILASLMGFYFFSYDVVTAYFLKFR